SWIVCLWSRDDPRNNTKNRELTLRFRHGREPTQYETKQADRADCRSSVAGPVRLFSPGLAPDLEDSVSAGQYSDRRDAVSGSVLHLAGNQAGARQRSFDRRLGSRFETRQNSSPESRTVAAGLGQGAARLAVSGAH